MDLGRQDTRVFFFYVKVRPRPAFEKRACSERAGILENILRWAPYLSLRHRGVRVLERCPRLSEELIEAKE